MHALPYSQTKEIAQKISPNIFTVKCVIPSHFCKQVKYRLYFEKFTIDQGFLIV